MSNRLASATSPYLLQHAENPVDWWQFGPDAFAAARSRDVPVLLSVGYAACHWCHVMAHESFEDPTVGSYVNEHFVAVKVDREQRPDVDSTYMAATQLLTGQGGWPMTVFLTPQGRAFHAGTYYPPRPHPSRPSFMQVLRAVTEAWTRRRGTVLRGAEQVTEALRRHPDAVAAMLGTAPEQPGAVVEPAAEAGAGDTAAALVARWLDGLEAARDPAHEGFGTGAKFPPSPVLEALVEVAAREDGEAHVGGTGAPDGGRGADRPATSAPRALGLLTATLDAIVVGALHDHVGGGFFRYSVTPDWSLPHYEKMLSDNAQLLRVLAHTAGLLERTGSDPLRAARYRHAAGTTVAWLEREMLTRDHAIAASLDADSDPAEPGGEREGAYYTFQREGEPAQPVTAAWDQDGATTGILDREVRERLWELRQQRAAPHRDDKVITAWNGMAIEALAEASVLLDHPRWLGIAERAAHYLWEHHRDAATGFVARTSRRGTVDPHEGQLEDHVRLGLGLLALSRAAGDTEWYRRCVALAECTLGRFMREGGVLHDSAEPDAVLGAAGATGQADPFDDVAASAQSCLARWLVQLGRPEPAGAPVDPVLERLLAPARGLVARAPTAAGGTVHAALLHDDPQALIEVVNADREQWERVLATVGHRRVTNVLVLDAAVAPYGVPEAQDPRFAAWLCRDGRCELPARDPRDVAGLLGGDALR